MRDRYEQRGKQVRRAGGAGRAGMWWWGARGVHRIRVDISTVGWLDEESGTTPESVAFWGYGAISMLHLGIHRWSQPSSVLATELTLVLSGEGAAFRTSPTRPSAVSTPRLLQNLGWLLE